MNMTANNEITLEQLLKARDERAEKQKKLIGKYDSPLISFTVNMPGAHKKTPVSGSIFREGYAALVRRLEESGMEPVYRETNSPVTGSEAYVVVYADAGALKELAIQIENQHPLGRLFDFDVIGRDGFSISREVLGYPKRKCLLCEEDAHACARSKRHPLEEIEKKIKDMTETYLFSGKKI